LPNKRVFHQLEKTNVDKKWKHLSNDIPSLRLRRLMHIHRIYPHPGTARNIPTSATMDSVERVIDPAEVMALVEN
jgi:hypothetical protein